MKVFCSNCNEYKKRFIEQYIEPIRELRDLDNNLKSTNIDSVEFVCLCPNCNSKVELIE